VILLCRFLQYQEMAAVTPGISSSLAAKTRRGRLVPTKLVPVDLESEIFSAVSADFLLGRIMSHTHTHTHTLDQRRLEQDFAKKKKSSLYSIIRQERIRFGNNLGSV
jgi:hypothetical protein